MRNEQEVTLIELQSAINLSRDEYLRECALYAEGPEQIEKEIIDGYFQKFCDEHPARAQIAKEKAQDAIDEIKNFHSAMAKLSINVAIASTNSELLALSLQRAGIQALFDDLDAFNQRVLNTLNRSSSNKEPHNVNPSETLEEHRNYARNVCERLITVQSLAAQVLRLRRETLQSIHDDFLTVTFKDVLQKIGEHLANTPRDEIVSKSWDAFAEAVAEILEEIVDEELPTSRVKRVLEALQKAIGIRKAKTDPSNDGTNDMLNLLSLLQRSSEVLAELDAEVEELLKAVDSTLSRI